MCGWSVWGSPLRVFGLSQYTDANSIRKWVKTMEYQDIIPIELQTGTKHALAWTHVIQERKLASASQALYHSSYEKNFVNIKS